MRDDLTDQRRLVRIETRLTNLGRYLGVDLTRKPSPNRPDQPVFIDNGAVYATPTTTLGELATAVLRYQGWTEDDRDVPVYVGGNKVATVDPQVVIEKLKEVRKWQKSQQ